MELVAGPARRSSGGRIPVRPRQRSTSRECGLELETTNLMNPNRDYDCGSARPLLAAFAREELKDEEAKGVQRHIEACPACATHVEFERRLAGRLRELRAVEVPRRLEQRVRTVLRNRS